MQAWECLRQYTIDQDWKATWPLSFQGNPFGSIQLVGEEGELADVAAQVEAEDRLAKRLAAGAKAKPKRDWTVVRRLMRQLRDNVQ